MLSSLVTTVVTPSKWPRPRCAPSSVSVSAARPRTVGGEAVRVDLLDAGREEEVDARRRGQRGVALPRRAGRPRGRLASLNCAGLTNSDTTTTSQCVAGAARSATGGRRGSAPIVGTSPIERPGARGSAQRGAQLGDGADGPHAASALASAASARRGVGERVEQREQLGRAARRRLALARRRSPRRRGRSGRSARARARARPSSRPCARTSGTSALALDAGGRRRAARRRPRA